jgi:hypothetical protein
MNNSTLRAGDVVWVRSATEILATLDATGALEELPFMPEMIPLLGQRFVVSCRAEKLCDTINNQLTSRRMANTVYLEELRCDGSGHGGCQAECLIYWKEAWLQREEPVPARTEADQAQAREALRQLVEANSTYGEEGDVRFRCQATQMVAATEALSTVDPRVYIREYTSGNVPLGRFARVMVRAIAMQSAHHFGKLPSPPLKGPNPTTPPSEPLDLVPGEWVRVKSPEAIRATLTDKGANRGLWFDREMAAMCGRTFQVRQRVTHIVDDRTGKMLQMKSECIKLEGGVCSGDLSTGRWFCPRKIYSYFRESWLERVAGPA